MIGVEGYGSLLVYFPNEQRGVTAKLERVYFVPILALNHFSFLDAHKQGLGFVTDDEDMSVTLVDDRLRVWSDGYGHSNLGRRMNPTDDDYIPFSNSVLEPIETPCSLLIMFPWYSPW